MQCINTTKTPTPLRHLAALGLLLFSFSAMPAPAQGFVPSEYRNSVAGDKFDDVEQFALVFPGRPTSFLRADRIEFAVGAISDKSRNRLFVSLGPVWRLPFPDSAAFVEFGFSPTWIDSPILNDRDLGGHFHFTSAVSVGIDVGAQQNLSLALRVQHTSNGGLNETNPGLDMIGLNFAIHFSDQ